MKRGGIFTPNNLRRYRKLMGYQQKEVAFLLGLKGAGRISEWEQGTSKPSMDNLFQLSLIYRTLPDELYYDLREEFKQELRERERILEASRDQGG